MTGTSSKRLSNWWLAALAKSGMLASAALTGCALHYYDTRSGTEHVWGVGHMKMKVSPPNEGVQAVVKGTETLGLSLAAGQEDYHIDLGWDYRRRIVVASNAMVRLEWPNGDFFNVRAGTAPPFAANSSATNSLAGETK